MSRASELGARDLHGDYSILLTAAPQGSIPPQIWRRAYVIYS
jgi:hypothetical protein